MEKIASSFCSQFLVLFVGQRKEYNSSLLHWLKKLAFMKWRRQM
jgi:hypothetical protein